MQPRLYPGETLDLIAGFPTIYHYQPPSDRDAQSQPLIVCVPGSLHLGRIFSGGHAGSIPQDFLAYWLSKSGFPVLSLSYPLDSEPGIMPPTAAAFRISDWGCQAARTASKVITDQALTTRSVVLISWSMGGRMVVPFTLAAKELGLDVQQYISFAATPGFSSSRPLPPGLTCSESGYFSVPSRLDVFHQQLAEMQELNGGREVTPRSVYRREYVGATPINLIGLGLKYDAEQGFVQDEVRHEDETQVLNIAAFPFITALYPTSILDASHALADRASWGFLLTRKLDAMIGKEGICNVQRASRWQAVLDLVQSAPARLCLPVAGNHFFFVGEQSARQTAAMVVRLIREASDFQSALSTLLS